MNDDMNMELSAKGAERRNRMLVQLQSEMQRVHRVRRFRRRAAGIAAPVLGVILALIMWQFTQQPPAQSPNEIAAKPAGIGPFETTPPPSPAAPVQIVRVQTDPNIVDRYRAVSTPRAETLDDDALLIALAEINRPTGLIRSEGRTWLTEDVVDDPPPPGS